MLIKNIILFYSFRAVFWLFMLIWCMSFHISTIFTDYNFVLNGLKMIFYIQICAIEGYRTLDLYFCTILYITNITAYSYYERLCFRKDYLTKTSENLNHAS